MIMVMMMIMIMMFAGSGNESGMIVGKLRTCTHYKNDADDIDEDDHNTNLAYTQK